MSEEKLERLEQLKLEYEGCARCPRLANPKGRRRHNIVFGKGNPNAKIIIAGEGPGEREDLKGEPFIGPSGDLLDKFMFSFNIDLNEVYILNCTLCRATEEEEPNKNREPTPEEVANCLPRLHRAIEIIDPYILLLLGASPLAALTDGKRKITSIARDASVPRLTVYTKGVSGMVERPAIATFHPAYLLRNPSMEEGSDMHKAYLAFEKAFRLHDTYRLLYEGVPIPPRGEE